MRTIMCNLKWLAIGLMLTALAACSSSEGSTNDKAPENLVKVTIETVQPREIKDVLLLPGQTEALQDVTLASERDGRVEWVGPQEGQMVKKGQLVAKVDVSALKATLDRAEAAFKLADEAAVRRQSLHKRGVLPQEELDRALTERTLALGNLTETKVHYQQGFVRAPIKGRINKLYVDPGEYVAGGAPVAELVNVDQIRINTSVPELDVRYLKVGQQALVTIDAFPGEKILGTVDFVAYKADPATKTFKVRVVVDNPGDRIRPGMIARVAFLRREVTGALTAPLTAILDKGGERIIFVEKDGVARARTISPGVLDGDRVQITKGLEPGDHLIVAGQTEVEEGMKVSVK